MELKSHWEQVYTTKSAEAVSWYQPHATLSLDLICRLAQSKATRIVDVGGGASSLVDDLLARGMTEVGVLDISSAALHVA
ncbi:MAG: SAM-dependent methyltransferase, partial [Polaromonas sp.]